MARRCRTARGGWAATWDRARSAPPAPTPALYHANAIIKRLPEVVAWTEAIAVAVYDASATGLPIVCRGDHSLAAGTFHGVSPRAAERGQELFVLWLDAHRDFHTRQPARRGGRLCDGEARLRRHLPAARPCRAAREHLP